MFKLRIISFILALVLSIQMLPLAQIGFALSSNQWTEELPHGTAEDNAKSDNASSSFLPEVPHHFFSEISCTAANIYIHSSEQIPSNHSTDVVSPPPDLLA
jgi:hypothetical protein